MEVKQAIIVADACYSGILTRSTFFLRIPKTGYQEGNE